MVEFRDMKSNEDATEKLFFGRGFVCTGKLWDPNYPSFVLKNFSQTKIDYCHSRDFRNPLRYHGKGVLGIGAGNSAVDISLELSRDSSVLKPILVSVRRGTTILPIETKNGDPVDVLVTSRAFQYLLSSSARKLLFKQITYDVNMEFQKYGLPPPVNNDDLFAINNPIANLKESRAYIEALKKGLIKFVEGVTAFSGENGFETKAWENMEPSGISLASNIDSAIFCTGYRVGLDFLEPSFRSQVVKEAVQKSGAQIEYMNLFKECLCAQDTSIAFLTFLTTYGNESIVGSMQARWVTKFWVDGEFRKKVFNPEQFKIASEAKRKFLINSNAYSPFFVRKFGESKVIFSQKLTETKKAISLIWMN